MGGRREGKEFPWGGQTDKQCSAVVRVSAIQGSANVIGIQENENELVKRLTLVH